MASFLYWSDFFIETTTVLGLAAVAVWLWTIGR